MNFDEFKSNFVEFVWQYKTKLNEEQLKKFYNYMNLLNEWNKKINLTAIIEPKDVIEKHFVDSLTAMDFINDKSKIIDIGTGAGFPGIPLKIANNTLEITLLDSLQKRVNFLNVVINDLNLSDIYAVHSRAEDFISNNRESFDIAISRAVANISTLSEYLLPYVKVGGTAIFMKGPNIKEELENGKKAIKLLGGKVEEVNNFTLGKNNERNIIIVRKISNTPTKFPRKAGKPAKNPIK